MDCPFLISPLPKLVTLHFSCSPWCTQTCLTQEPMDRFSVQVRGWLHRDRSLVLRIYKLEKRKQKRPMVREKEMKREYYPFERVLGWPRFISILHNEGSGNDNCQNSWFWGSGKIPALATGEAAEQNGLLLNSTHVTNIFGLGPIHNCLPYRALTLKKEILYETISVLPSEDRKDLKDCAFWRLQSRKSRMFLPELPRQHLPLWHKGRQRSCWWVFKCCSDNVFYFHGEEEKKAIGRKKLEWKTK